MRIKRGIENKELCPRDTDPAQIVDRDRDRDRDRERDRDNVRDKQTETW